MVEYNLPKVGVAGSSPVYRSVLIEEYSDIKALSAPQIP